MASPDLPPPAPRRFYPVAFALGLMAWLVIAFMVLAFILNNAVSEKKTEAAGKDNLNDRMIQFQARVFIGQREVLGSAVAGNQGIFKQAETLDAGPIDQRLRFAILAGELSGPDEALYRLNKLKRLVAHSDTDFSPEQRAQLATLRQLYGDFSKLQYDAPSVSKAQRQQLRDELSWFGDLALAPAGQPEIDDLVVAAAGGPAAVDLHAGCPDPAGREQVLWQARRVFYIAAGALAGAGGALLLGMVGLLIMGVLLALGLLRGGLRCGTSPAGVYAETFALYLVLFAGFHIALEQFNLDRLLASGLADLCCLLALLWPVLRGVGWRQTRQDLGLTLGRLPPAEPVIGIGCYIMEYPLIVVGTVLMLALMAAQQFLLGGPSPDDLVSPPSPSHPVIGPLASGDWWVRLMILVLASLMAPLIEETMFRGVLYRHLRELTHRFGMPASVVSSALISSFIFAVIHPQGLVAVPALMALAFGFCLIREWRGTLIPSMVAHGLHNTLLLVVTILMLSD